VGPLPGARASSSRGLRFVQAPLPNGPGPPRHAVEFAFARFVHMARRSTGVDVRPTLVRLAFPRPANTGPHEALFGCPLLFDHARNELELDAATLDLPQRAADPWLRTLVEKQGQALLARLGQPPGFAAEVTAALTIEVQKGRGDLASVGRALALSKRTLQRRLDQEGVSFRALTDEVRCGLATQYLVGGRTGLSEIALLLGFSEQAAFQRAFLRWTGVTPGQYRRGERAHARLA
jgi:AraC-like DNA-binding protein